MISASLAEFITAYGMGVHRDMALTLVLDDTCIFMFLSTLSTLEGDSCATDYREFLIHV